MILYSFDPMKNEKIVAGEYNYDKSMFIKKVNSRHYMIKEQGYGISEDVVQQLIQLDCALLKIESKRLEYIFRFEDILNLPKKNYGHGEQRFLKI